MLRLCGLLHLFDLFLIQCNFRCIYCYESFPNISMKPEIEEGVIRWVRKRTKFVKVFRVGRAFVKVRCRGKARRGFGFSI